jgi:hypothetical protein
MLAENGGFPWLYRVGIVAVAATLLAGVSPRLGAAGPETATVRLVVDYGDGVEVHFTRLAWRKGMTVLDALAAARKHRHGVSFAHRGSGSSALITKIGDVENQGGGQNSKNWLYSINGKPAEVGAGAMQLNSGDAILWKFQVYE